MTAPVRLNSFVSFCKLFLADYFNGAAGSASAAADAGVSVDNVLVVALRNCFNGAVSRAVTALNASISDNVCHVRKSPFLDFVI